MSDSRPAIDALLPFAVHMWRDELVMKGYDYCVDRFNELSKTLPSEIGSKGDILLYGGGKKGEAADLFNKTTEALALLALLCPGGVPGGSDSSPSFGPYCFDDFAEHRK